MIRVLQVFTIMNRGGAETMIMNYYRNIDRSRVQFDFLVHREERAAYDDEIEALGGKIYRMMPVHPVNIPAYKKQLDSFFDSHRDYKVIHGNCSELGVYVYEEAAKRGVPVIIAHAHNSTAAMDFKAPFRFLWKHRMRRYITDMFSCGPESSKYLFGKNKGKNALVLNNAVDAWRLTYNLGKRIRLRKEMGIEGRFVIGHVGRFNIQKNHKFLIEIFSEIYRRNPNAVLLLAGTGELEESIRKQVSEKGLTGCVRFLGMRPDIPDLLNVFDIFLFPSLFEGLPVTLVEGQANGLRCIASDSIPKESEVTGLVEYHSLKKPPEYWAGEVLKHEGHCGHKVMYHEIVKKGFDIKENARWLEEYYVNEYGKYKE